MSKFQKKILYDNPVKVNYKKEKICTKINNTVHDQQIDHRKRGIGYRCSFKNKVGVLFPILS